MTSIGREWRLLETGARSGAWNMACDAALLEAVGRREAPPTARFFGWEPAAVSLGRHQPELDARAQAELVARRIDWVRRPTGGRLVYHGPSDQELTYSVVAPIGEPPVDGNLGAAYRSLHEALTAGLRELGVPATLTARVRSRSLPPRIALACFATSVPYEIAVDGRKLVGSAQRRARGALLQHGSIPLAGDPSAVPDQVWPGSLDRAALTTVSAALRRPIGFREAVVALRRGIEATLGVRLVAGVLTDTERAAIDARLARGSGSVDPLPARAPA